MFLFRSAGDAIAKIRSDQGIEDTDLAKEAGIRVSTLRDIESGVPPTDNQLEQVSQVLSVPPDAVRLVAGQLSDELLSVVSDHPERALSALEYEFDDELDCKDESKSRHPPEPIFQTQSGTLFNEDCREVLPTLEDESFDCVFADPPFNLKKDYGENGDDDLTEEAYLRWSTEWIDQAIDLLKPGGSFFLYNIPGWNIHLAHYLSQRLTFRHWIAVDIKFRLPIPNRLYPSHYSLLYFVKGDGPSHFDPPRLPIDTCPHCGGEQNDYGGYKNKLNPEGLNLTDVWDDIPPVRHSKYKNRDSNELSLKLLHRVLKTATEPGDKILDPFGGAGTTYAACELMDRQWVGTELNSCSPIEDRLSDLAADREQIEQYERNQNVLFTEDALDLRSEYRDIFNFNFEDYNLEKSVDRSHQQTFDSL